MLLIRSVCCSLFLMVFMGCQSTESGSEAPESEFPDNLKVVFVSYRTGTAEIFLCNPDGSEVLQITESSNNNSFPESAGDGQSIVYRSTDPNDRSVFTLRKINIKTGEDHVFRPELIVDDAEGENESPDGVWVSYAKSFDHGREFYLHNRETGQTTQITKNLEDSIPATQPYNVWTFDSRKIAFLSGPDWYNQYITYYDVEAKELKKATERGYMCAGLQWNKEGKGFIANLKILDSTYYELWSVNIDTKEMMALTDNPARGNIHPKISPDGEWVLFESGRNMNEGDIYIMRPDGSDVRRLTDEESYEGRPEWLVLY